MLQRWTPTPIWEGQKVYIIGGGPSLKTFEWGLLQGRFVLGCNAAVYLGVGVCPYILFGDATFFKRNLPVLEGYVEAGGMVITSSHAMKAQKSPPWLYQVKKQLRGLSTEKVAWNGNTGAAAINLALLMGAQTVYLLGYDMKLDAEGAANFHNVYPQGIRPTAFKRFLRGMAFIAQALPEVFPGRAVINLTEDSELNSFPKESLVSHFEEVGV